MCEGHINIPGLLNNAESWNLTIGDRNELDKIEINSLKNLFDLPIRTPTPAIIYAFAKLKTSIRVDKKQLLYLHRIVTRKNDHWTKKTLLILQKLNMGWYKQIMLTLTKYNLERNLETIKNIPFPIWKSQVVVATKKKHKEMLIEDCYKKEGNINTVKTKTSFILKNLETIE